MIIKTTLLIPFIVFSGPSVQADNVYISTSSSNTSSVIFQTDDSIDTPPYQEGFPINTGGQAHYSSPQVADIDNDGDLEIIIGSGSHDLVAYHHDGTPVSGFPVLVEDPDFTPAIADIDKDGEMEIVMPSLHSDLFVFNGDGTLESGWPQPLSSTYWGGASCSPALADLDNDEDMEIIVGTYGYEEYGREIINARMYVFHHDGILYDGWPVYNVDFYAVKGSPAVGDIDNDGDLEIVAPGSEDQVLWAWHSDGTVVDNWPVLAYGNIYSSPTMADVDSDGDLEIFIATSFEKVYGFHHDGTLVTGWPQPMGETSYYQSSSPAIGDIDGDGDLEIVCGSACWDEPKLYAWHHDGTAVTGWPQIFTIKATPALGDVDGDGDIEIIAASSQGIHIWHDDGTLLPGYPVYTGSTMSSPTLTDLDQDGDIEILSGAYNKNLYCWDLSGIYNPEFIEWGMFRHDLLNTGLYSPGGVGITEDPQTFDTGTACLFQNSPNPFNNSTVICYQLQETGNVTLRVFDISGKLIRILLNETQSSGDHSVIWDGRTSSGTEAAPGIYLYRLETGSSIISKEMILLR